MAGKYNIVADQGATFNLNFTVKTDGIAWDLTDYSADMHVSKSTSSATNLLDLSSANEDITLNNIGGVSITASAVTMTSIPSGRWTYNIELTSPDLTVTRILEGRFIVSAEVA
jgi:hypothetical protein